METLAERAKLILQTAPATPAIEFESHWHTWGDLAAVADKISALLGASGIPANAPVALVSRNHPALIAALIGLIAENRTIQMIYPFQASSGIIRDINRLKPAAIILTPTDLTPDVEPALQSQTIAAILCDNMAVSAAPGLEISGPTTTHATINEPQIEVLTSGTTGPPKQFPIRFALIRDNYISAALTPPAPDAPPFLLYMPLGNISGIYTTLPTLLNGHRARLLERFNIPAWVDYVKTYRPTQHGVPPSMLGQLLDLNIAKTDLASLKSMGSGAAPLDPAVQQAFEDHYGIPVLLSYGATEFGGPVCGMTLELHREFGRSKLGTVGRKYPHCDLRIIDPDNGTILPANSDGLIEVLAPRIQPDWISTSDIGMIDADGFLFLRGRADGAIMRGGFKILPETIERALLQHPSVAEAAVVAVTDARVAQVPGAMIRLKPDQNPPTIDALTLHLRQLVMATHLPVHWRFVESLPRNPSMKIDRVAIKRAFSAP
ncbi:MAG: hypothetical protein RLY97_590 [Pseudomonadota bacterium]